MFFKKRRQTEEALRKMRAYVIRKMPKGSINKVTKNRIFFYNGFDINNEIFQALVKFSERAPTYYSKIKMVTIGESQNCVFFNIHFY